MKLQRVGAFVGVVLLSSVIGMSLAFAEDPFKPFGGFLKKQAEKDAAEQRYVGAQKGKKKKPGGGGQVARRNINYAGYSGKFLTVKVLLAAGKAQEAYQFQQKKLEESKKEPNLLFSLEQATIALDANKPLEAREHLAYAERLLDNRQDRSVSGGFFKELGSEIIKAGGFSEFGEYKGEAYERILMLNFKSIAYMLEGSRKAYNVTRRAIDWQNQEKKAFDQKIDEVKEKLKEEEETQTEKGNDLGSLNLFGVISEQYKSSRSKALQVSSAFVNPFGFYMAGIVQEFDSYEDPSLRDNARISYKKALELNPDSKVIKQSIQEIQEKAPQNKRLVQIVVADGFAPEKKVLRFDYLVDGNTVPIKLTIYEPDESLVDRIEVQSADGNKLTTLSNVADIDAITLRHQYDSLPEQHLRMSLAIIRSVFENKLFEKTGIFGAIAKQFREDTTNPDTRSWMSMPKQILAARLYLPKDSGALRLVSYDKKGK
ncbi:MAG: hypothetical protein ACE5IH_00605, partial [Thermodesulfobacteriota bacterium]